jgi:hypothetical protein
MSESMSKNKQGKSAKFDVRSVLANSIYVATVIMILAYLYQSFGARI